MRQLTENELREVKTLTENSVEFTLIEPTENGLNKSIMDATGPIRAYLKASLVHDYEQQTQGPEHKITVKAFFADNGGLIPSIASLYRPVTKNGDPRIWFKGLGDYCKPNDILAILYYSGTLYLINITKFNLGFLLENNLPNPFEELIRSVRSKSLEVSKELLFLLKRIASKGPIPALLNADTSIGRTLETLLGIDINSSKKPDYKGIELKSYRDKKGNRKNLFAQVPNWEMSKFKSSEEILKNFGYNRGVDFKLYCTVSAIVRNSQGLKLKLDSQLNQLIENSDRPNAGDFVVWTLENLHRRLLEKHNETFWIAADSLLIDGREYFHYKKVEHTKKPIVSQFDILLDQGIITLDHLIKRNISGKVVEKGPLFKIKPKSLNLLFPPSSNYNLV